MFVETSGRRWSSDRITTRPFDSVYFSYLIVGRAMSPDAPAEPLTEEAAAFAGAIFGGAFFVASWLKTEIAKAATVRIKISTRLRIAEFIRILLTNCATRI